MNYVLDQYNQKNVEVSDLSNTSIYMSSDFTGIPRRKQENSDSGTTISSDALSLFYSECIQMDSALSAGNTFYLHVKIKRLVSAQRFYIYLCNYTIDDNEEEKTQYVKTIDVQAGDPNTWADCEVVFSPLIDFDCILFQLQRTIDDYRTATRYPRIIYEELSEVNNIITTQIGYGTELVKIGVQSHPGLIMCINGEEIRVGRSGIYEIRNGIISVNSFSVLQAAEEDPDGSNPLRTKDGEVATLDEYLAEVAAESDAEGASATNSRCIFSNSKLRGMDAFVLDYMYKEGEE
jgi:hypothetical protein